MKQISKATFFMAAGLMAVCSCVKEQLPTGGFGRGYINPVVSLAGETTKSSGTAPEGRYMGSYAMDGFGSDSLYISVYEYDNTDLPYGLAEEEPQTKGRVTTTESINATGQQFTLDAWLESENRYDGSQDGDGRVYITTDKDNWHIMDGVTVERGTSGWGYTSGLEYPWRNQVATNFWSVYPVHANGRTITFPDDQATDSEQKALTFTYNPGVGLTKGAFLDSDAANLPDLCFAYNNKTWSDGDDNKFNIKFHHALAAVYFSVDGVIDGVNVQNIGIDNVWSAGDCDVTGNTGDTPTFTWKNQDRLAEFKQDYSYADFDAVTGVQPFTGSEKIYMAIPQVLGNTTALKVKFILGDGNALTKSVNISKFEDGTPVEWKPGKKYLYKLSANNIDFDYTLSIDSTSVNFIPTAWPPFRDLSIDSYKKKKGTTDIRPVAWKVVKYSTDGGTTWQNYDWTDATTPTPIDWTSMPSNFRYGFGGIGGYPSSWFAVYPAFEPQIVYTPYTNALRGNGTRGSSTSPWDLSTHTASGADCNMSTANCYIVDRAGTYKLPLVYGPSIYDGQTVASAFTSACAAEGDVFVNHLGSPIETPFIYQNAGCESINIKDAVLVYQDVEGIISGVELCDSGHYLKFNVESANLQQCNAIVAVRDNNDRIMWSWHIWVTAENYSITKRLGSTDFALMDIGTVRPAKETRYQRREARVVFRQDESGLLDTLTIVQLPLTIPEYETCPTYQWGRKDPMLRALNPTGDSHSYTTDGTDAGPYKFDIIKSDVSTATAIQHPQIIYTGNPADSTEWNSGKHLKILWNNQANPNFEPSDVVKTVYDPSPVGYCVPIFNAAFGLLKNVSADTYFSNEPAEFNGIFIDKGFNAACSPSDTLLFPFSGYRLCGGGYLGGYGELGQWWTADRLTYNNPLCFSIYKHYENTESPLIIRRSFWSKAANAYAVRPMKYTP